MFKENIYELIIKYPNLNDNILHKYGYSDNDIKNFVKRNIIVKFGDVYVVNNVDDLMKYYNTISRTRDYAKQAKILDLVLSIQPNYYNVLKQRFFVSIKLGDNETALYCFKKIYNRSMRTCFFDTKLQLYLLSKLIDVGELNKDLIGIELKDIRIPDKDTRYQDKERKNISRAKILNNEFEEAYDMIYSEDGYDKKLTFQELIIVSLLNRVVSKYKNGHNYIECIQQGRYQDALVSLNKKDYPTYYDQLVKKLLEFYLNPPDQIFIEYDHPEGLWESIESNDFRAAYDLNEKYNKDKGIDDETSPITILLTEIMNMLDLYINYGENPDDEEYYQVYYISHLLDLGYTFKGALEISGFSDEIKNFISLIYAKEAFRLGHYKTGNYFLYNCYKKSKEDGSTQELYDEIVNNCNELVYSQPILSKALTMPKNK